MKTALAIIGGIAVTVLFGVGAILLLPCDGSCSAYMDWNGPDLRCWRHRGKEVR